MPVLTPDHAPQLQDRLRPPDTLLVACLCAAWCGTCRDYEAPFAELAARLPEHVFVWVDIEDHPDLLEDEDVENFPTLLVQHAAGTLFYGPMLPHIGHLERLLGTMDNRASGTTQAPALRAALAAG